MESVFETVVMDPGLPAELLPEDWPKASLAESMERFYPVIGRQAVARLRELLPEIEIADPSSERPTGPRPAPRVPAEPSRPAGRVSAARI
jgi:hypothetical protein